MFLLLPRIIGLPQNTLKDGRLFLTQFTLLYVVELAGREFKLEKPNDFNYKVIGRVHNLQATKRICELHPDNMYKERVCEIYNLNMLG